MKEDQRADLRCGGEEGPDMSPFLPELCVGAAEGQAPLELHGSSLSHHCCGAAVQATALHPGWAGAVLRSLSLPTQPEPGKESEVEHGEKALAGGSRSRASGWPGGSRAGTGSSADRGLLLALFLPSPLAHLTLTSGVQVPFCLWAV